MSTAADILELLANNPAVTVYERWAVAEDAMGTGFPLGPNG